MLEQLDWNRCHLFSFEHDVNLNTRYTLHYNSKPNGCKFCYECIGLEVILCY